MYQKVGLKNNVSISKVTESTIKDLEITLKKVKTNSLDSDRNRKNKSFTITP
jgi:hypothetical protein